MADVDLDDFLDKLSNARDQLIDERDVALTKGETAKVSTAEAEIERISVILSSVQFFIDHETAMNMNAVAARLRDSIEAQRAVGLSTAMRSLEKLVNRIGADGVTPPLRLGTGGPSTEPGGSDRPPTQPPHGNMDTPTPPPAGGPGQFVQARKIADKTILYTDDQGRGSVREGGSRAWRNNNPGNIRKGTFANTAGAIGDDGAFAVFPEYKIGFDAIVGLLRSQLYINLSLKDAVFKYAPPNENDSAQYLAFLVGQTGIAATTVLSSLAVADIRKIAKFIQVVEGWQEGTERPDGPPSLGITGGAISSAAGAAMEWMDVAKREASLPAQERSQWSDPGENPRILQYFKTACAWFDPVGGDEVDWCAAFVNYCLVTAGYTGTNHPGARSFFWNKNNQFVRLDGPRFGAIAVRRYPPFSDPTWATGEGHVGFVNSWTSDSVELLGGNQSNTVRLQTFPLVARSGGSVTAEFIAFMMPAMH